MAFVKCAAACFAAIGIFTETTATVVSPPRDLFVTGVSTLPWSQGQSACYRLPSLLRTQGGTLLAFASERLGTSCSDESGTNIVLRRSFDGGQTWAPAQLVLAAGPEKAEMTVWLLQDAMTGRIFLFSNTNVHQPVDCNCEVFHITSDNEGDTWSERTVIPPSSGFYGMSLATGITHSSGRLVGCMRKICRNSCPQDYASKAFFSDDRGATWQTSAFLESGSTECQLAELSDGRLYMNMRPLNYTGPSTSASFEDRRLISFSSDAGQTWSEVESEPALVDYGFADEGSVVSDPANSVMYFSHPEARDRSNLTLYRSFDDASSWDDFATVYTGSAAYSSIQVLDPSPVGAGRAIGVLFERDAYGAMAFLTVAEEDSGKLQI